MQNKINAIDAGLIGTLSMLAIHLIWIILVFTNLAKPVIDYVFWMHFIKPLYEIVPFNVYTAINLLLIVACVGFLVGYLFAKAFNLLSSNDIDIK